MILALAIMCYVVGLAFLWIASVMVNDHFTYYDLDRVGAAFMCLVLTAGVAFHVLAAYLLMR